MAITKRSEAKESAFAEVREKLVSFEGDVISAEFGMWAGGMNPDGSVKKPKEYLEVKCTNVKVLEVTGTLPMEVLEWNWRENCSDFKGSFWIEQFLASADKFQLLIPEGIIGKRVLWRKAVLKIKMKTKDVEASNFIIAGILGNAGAYSVGSAAVQTVQIPVSTAPSAVTLDPMLIALELAIGKTEAQFRSAIGMHPVFVGSPLLKLAQNGAITESLRKDGKLIEVMENGRAIYKKP